MRGALTYAEVPRVDQERLAHVCGDAHELAEHQRALLGLLLRDDELHGSCVHAVTERGDDTEVGDAEQGVELVLLDRLVAVQFY